MNFSKKDIGKIESGINCFELVTGEEICGETISLNEDYLSLHLAVDFHFDGIAHIELKNIVGLISSEANDFYSRLFKRLNSKPLAEINFPMTFVELLMQIKKTNSICIFELEKEMHIGGVVNFNDEIITISPITSTGDVAKDYRISCSDIIFIKEDSEYVNVFSDYVKKL